MEQRSCKIFIGVVLSELFCFFRLFSLMRHIYKRDFGRRVEPSIDTDWLLPVETFYDPAQMKNTFILVDRIWTDTSTMPRDGKRYKL